MRRLLILGVLLVMLSNGATAAAAAAPFPTVTGHWAFVDATRSFKLSITAIGTDPPKGFLRYDRLDLITGQDRTIDAVVTCVEVDGPDAWIAGAVTSSTWISGGDENYGILFRIRDGGNPGVLGDKWLMAAFFKPVGEPTPTTPEDWCHGMVMALDDPFWVTSGNFVVHGIGS